VSLLFSIEKKEEDSIRLVYYFSKVLVDFQFANDYCFVEFSSTSWVIFLFFVLNPFCCFA